MATCPPGPVPSNEWTIWKGPVPPSLVSWAVQDLRAEAEFPYGHEWTTEFNGQQVLAIKQHHTWTYHNGRLVTGICIPGITLYKPKKVGVEEQPVDLEKPDGDIAWYDEGEGIHWPTIAWSAAGFAAVIILFFLALKFAKKKSSS